ncbi:MAG: dihydroorotate dehydrogenase-like protein [Chloroflexi bacterium]|nr:dihydroorotate dehydrogenase-like protein [Chloroflexota bacterium]
MDLTTSYLGLNLRHPIVPSASPLSASLDGIRRLEDAGAAAVVLPSLFEEQIDVESHTLDHYLGYAADSFAEARNYFPEASAYRVGPDQYLETIAHACRATDIPIVASLNGVSTGGWVEYARLMQEAGAHALELNVYYIPTDPRLTGGEVEEMYLDVLRDVKRTVTIPVAVKLSPFFSAPANMAARLADAGADGLVLFNRFYQPDFDLETLSVVPHLTLSSAWEARLPLRWVALMYGRVPTDLAITGGVQTYEDVLKGVMAGASVMMLTSELLRNGIGRIGEILHGLAVWMEEREYESVSQMQGSMSQMHVAEPAAFERANYMKVLHSWRPDPAAAVLTPRSSGGVGMRGAASSYR